MASPARASRLRAGGPRARRGPRRPWLRALERWTAIGRLLEPRLDLFSHRRLAPPGELRGGALPAITAGERVGERLLTRHRAEQRALPCANAQRSNRSTPAASDSIAPGCRFAQRRLGSTPLSRSAQAARTPRVLGVARAAGNLPCGEMESQPR